LVRCQAEPVEALGVGKKIAADSPARGFARDTPPSTTFRQTEGEKDDSQQINNQLFYFFQN
jgi:hypothetical protein